MASARMAAVRTTALVEAWSEATRRTISGSRPSVANRLARLAAQKARLPTTSSAEARTSSDRPSAFSFLCKHLVVAQPSAVVGGYLRGHLGYPEDAGTMQGGSAAWQQSKCRSSIPVNSQCCRCDDHQH